MTVSKKDLQKRIDAAAKRVKADLVIKNGYVVDVFNQELIRTDVAIAGGVIVGLGEYEGLCEIDAANKYICPSFIDGHVHIESAMVTPAEFAKVVMPHGVTTIIADPHEIANVAGKEGIQYMLDSSEDIPLHVYMMLPSCVPATPFENAGAVLRAADLEEFYDHPRVLGLGEVMDYPSVLRGEDTMMEKLFRAHHHRARIDGHAAGLDGDALNVYATAGIKTDHETISEAEAKERLMRGMYLIIRQGSVAKDLPNLIGVVTDKNARRCLFGTDDKHIDDLLHEGSIDHSVRLAISHGVDPLNAIQMASLSAAECFGLTTKGAVAPGYDADFLILSDLSSIQIEQVYVSGILVAEHGVYTASAQEEIAVSASLRHSVHVKQFAKEDLQISLGNAHHANIIEIIPNSLITTHTIEEVTVRDGMFIPSLEKDHLKLAVIERHHRTGHIGLGIIKGLRLRNVALATTIAHDSHNIIVAGTNDHDIAFAVQELQRIGGGLLVVENGQVLASLPLSVGGIMSDDPYESIYEKLKTMKEALRKLEAPEEFNPFLTLSFLALPVIPALKLTDIGLFDVKKGMHIEVGYSEG